MQKQKKNKKLKSTM